MGFVQLVYLICDGDGCPHMTGQFDASTRPQAWRVATRLGWSLTVDGRYLCPRCLKKEQK